MRTMLHATGHGLRCVTPCESTSAACKGALSELPRPVALLPRCIEHRCRNRIAAFVKSFEDSGKTPPFLFILNILVPGTPVVSSVMYWAFDEDREGGSKANVTEEARSNDVFRQMLERCVLCFRWRFDFIGE